MASLGLEYIEYLLSSDSEPEIVPESPPAVPSTNPELGPVTESTPSFTFPLPPLNRQYSTYEEAREAVNTFARPYGYAVISIRSKFTKKGVKKTVPLIYDRGRPLHNDDLDLDKPHKRRRTTTLRLGYPFKITLRLHLEIGLWHLTIENPTYNHKPSPVSTHPIQRALDLTYKKSELAHALS